MKDTSTVPTIAAMVDASRAGQPITKYIYGQFIEHLGNLINNGLWAEMLHDRKFFFRISSGAEPQPAERPARLQLRPWRPIGPDEAVTMDRDHAYVGRHSPRIALQGAEPRGVQQSGLMLREGQEYVGRIVLRREPFAAVTVSLVWGPGPAERQTVSVESPADTWTTVPLTFTAGADTDDGRLEITGAGSGSFHVGAVSLMPANNLRGFRRDTIALLRELHSGIYRFPGGNYVSNHDWRDAIGDRDKRPPRWDHAWHVMQPNDVGTDEFMVLCELLDVEPYITVNAGFGEARSAADLVEYCNGAADTPMGTLRAANGHPEPYNVRWWGIGNEMYGWWQLGYMAVEHFVIKHNLFAQAMRAVDPTIRLIASGAMPDEMTVTTNARRVTGNVLAEYGTAADWTGQLLTHCFDNIDVISEHYYCHNGERFDLEYAQTCPLGTHAGFVKVEEPLVEWARRPANRVRCKVEAYEEYLQRIPGLRERRIPINIDEWAYSRMSPCLKQALSYAWAFHEMFRHSDVITMAAYTFATSCIDWDAADAAYNTTGLLFKLYRDHFGTVPLEVMGNSPQPPPQYPVGGDQPKVNAGSPTYPLDVAAALTADGQALTVAVVNATESAQGLNIEFQGVQLQAPGTSWCLTGPGPDAANNLGEAPQVAVTTATLDEVPSRLMVVPLSVTLFRFPIA